MPSINLGQLATLADHIHARRDGLLGAWQRSIKRDPKLTDGDALPRSELLDHIPALLDAYEQSLRRAASAQGAEAAGEAPAAAHGLQRWSQGYGLREVTRELGKLNGCVIMEIDAFGTLHSGIASDTLMHARQAWAAICCSAIETSVNQYFELAQEEAEGQVKGLEAAVEEIQALERQRGDLWREAAHDLRNNLGLVANAGVGLTRQAKQESQRGDEFLRLLMRGITSLHQLLDDVTGLARLQAGREVRQIEPIDASAILEPLCDTIRPSAQQRGLYLNSEGVAGLATDGDAVKIRRIAQNLILNAVKYTKSGGVSVRWGDCGPHDPKRWQLVISDTGPGFRASHAPLAAMNVDVVASNGVTIPQTRATNDENSSSGVLRTLHGNAGEGIGLSIVKRLCDMLDASIEMQSVDGVGTTFRILFPKHYQS